MHKKQIVLSGVAVLFLLLAFIFWGCSLGESQIEEIIDATTPRITNGTESFWYKIGDPDPQLSVTVENEDNGALTYQWYEYDFERGIGIPQASATNDTFSPTITDEKPGRPYRYYVEITNTNNSANGRRQIAITHTIDIIAYYPENAQMPLITRQPTGGTYRLSPRMTIPLSIASEVGDEGEQSYQWYQASANIAENGTPVPNSISNAITLSRDNFDEDSEKAEATYYYFAVATNTNIRVTGRRETQVISDVAVITLIRDPDAAVPEITTQPQGKIYFIGDTIAESDKLVVEADAYDGGDLSYQWYSNTVNSNTDGTLIADATDNEFLPTISTASAGSRYYYVVVTNTNDAATVNKSMSIASNVVKITVQSASVPAGAGADVEVDFTRKHQYVRGFGGMDVAWSNFPTYSLEDYENMYNPDRLGYNMLRIMIMPNYTDINRTMEELLANKISGSQDRSNYYEFVKIVNNYDGYVLASPWSPPAAWKTNNSINGGGELRPSNYQDFADYLRTFGQIMANNGAPIYAIALQNEPTWVAGYDGCEYTPEQNRDWFIRVGHFTTRNNRGQYDPVPGYGGGRAQTFVRTMGGESHNQITPFHDASMRNQTSRDAIDIIGAHIYGAGPRRYSLGQLTDEAGTGEYSPTGSWSPTGWTPKINNGTGTGGTDAKEIWMTEHNINAGSSDAYVLDSSWPYVWKFMNDVDLVVRRNQENAFIWWSSKRFYSMIGDGTYGTIDGAILPRGHGLSHYAKFAKETGMVGVTVTGYLGDDTTPVRTGTTSGANVNSTSGYSVDSTDAKITAYVTLRDGIDWIKDRHSLTIDDITAISMVIYTPTTTGGANGIDLGRITITLPEGFIIRDATAMRSTSQLQSQVEDVTIDPDRNKAYVSVPPSNIVSVRFTK